MAELTEVDIRNLAMILKSIKNKYDLEEYQDYVPMVITNQIDLVPTIEEFAIAESLQSAPIDDIITTIKRSYRTIKFEKESNPRHYWQTPAYGKTYKNLGSYSIVWKKIIELNRHIEVLEFMAFRPKPKKPPVISIEGCIGVWMCQALVEYHKIDEDFLNFIIDGKGKKYFNVPAKQEIVKYLYNQGRFDDMYRFCSAGSKVINDLVIQLSKVEDLPFLMGADGSTAKKRLEKRLDGIK